VLTACLIFLTIPVTVASAETMSQNRLSNIAILNIERSRTDELDIEKTIDNISLMLKQENNFFCVKINKKNYILMIDLYCFFIIVSIKY